MVMVDYFRIWGIMIKATMEAVTSVLVMTELMLSAFIVPENPYRVLRVSGDMIKRQLPLGNVCFLYITIALNLNVLQKCHVLVKVYEIC